MRYDVEFEPRLGKIRSRGGKRGRRYLRQVLRAVALAGGKVGSGAKPGRSTFHGNRIGRGAGVGRILAARDRYAAFRVRRAIVTTRIVKIGKGGLRSEEHTSELQSLMRISYAVFCLKKKKRQQ